MQKHFIFIHNFTIYQEQCQYDANVMLSFSRPFASSFTESIRQRSQSSACSDSSMKSRKAVCSGERYFFLLTKYR